MAGAESKQTKVWMMKWTIDSRYLAERQQSVSATLKSFWRLKVSECAHVCVFITASQSQVCLGVTGESWSHFDEGELTVLWLAGVTLAQSGAFSHSVQMSLFNQPLRNHMWGEQIQTHTRSHTFQKSREVFWAQTRSDDLKVCGLIVNHLVELRCTQKCVDLSYLQARPGPQRKCWGLLSRRPDSPRSS